MVETEVAIDKDTRRVSKLTAKEGKTGEVGGGVNRINRLPFSNYYRTLREQQW